ncbi:Glyoxalase/bleomycin resistance protein/dioxygenase [Planctomycetales bacterium 10988]|nr:Glyoxalase/bleomycin resistance protein/dioxygenase [Planctomycetales bacterium 10988]
MPARSHIPPGFQAINPYLIVKGADKLIAFLEKTFDAKEAIRIVMPSGLIGHAEYRIGASVVELAEATDEWQPMPASLHIYVEKIDECYAKAVAAGGETISDPRDQFYGERSASVRDPVGNIWHIATNTEDLSNEEIQRRAEAYFRENSE